MSYNKEVVPFTDEAYRNLGLYAVVLKLIFKFVRDDKSAERFS